MKFKEYEKAFFDLKADVINQIKSDLIKEQASEIQLHHGIIFQHIDDQFSEIIKRVNIEVGNVSVDTGDDYYSVQFNNLTLDQLLSILCEVEQGNYDVWAEFEEQ
jgi:hypothetical protein